MVGLVLIGVLTAHTARLLIDCKRELVARLELAMNETASEMDSNSQSINSSYASENPVASSNVSTIRCCCYRGTHSLQQGRESSMKHFAELVADKTYNSYEVLLKHDHD